VGAHGGGSLSVSAPMSATNVNVMGRRVGAAIVDLIVLGGLFVLVGILSGSARSSNGSYSINLVGGPALLLFALCFLYFIVLEWLAGATLGKMLFGLRVRAADGGKLSLAKSAARNLLRVVDGFPYFLPYLVGFVVAVSGTEKQRVGDRVAGVVVASRD
jgi:uncharacterized RDD family membrane protein YckC